MALLGKKSRLVVAFACLLLFWLQAASAQQVFAEAGGAPLAQATSYPVDPTSTPNNGAYPGMTDTPSVGRTNTPVRTPTPTTAGSGGTIPTATPVFGNPTDSIPSNTRVPEGTGTGTSSPNLFQTEDAEMGGSQVTPSASETPGPTITPISSATPTQITPTTTPVVKKGLFQGQVDWGMFWIGFSIPVLVCSGLVLYLLDRNPNFFRTRK
jgi:hypothetical protein